MSLANRSFLPSLIITLSFPSLLPLSSGKQQGNPTGPRRKAGGTGYSVSSQSLFSDEDNLSSVTDQQQLTEEMADFQQPDIVEESTTTENGEVETNWTETTSSFDLMDLKEDLLRGIYAYGFEKPSAIQQRGVCCWNVFIV